MWKFQHPEGQREINDAARARRPAGQAAADLRGRDPQLLRAGLPRPHGRAAGPLHVGLVRGRREPGDYHLFCSQYCGTNHAGMIGTVVVMEPADYQQLAALARRGVAGPARAGKMFLKYRCVSCHSADEHARAPVLEELYGKPVPLRDGRTVIADEDYIRESILQPGGEDRRRLARTSCRRSRARCSEEEIIELIAFIKSLQPRRDAAAGRGVIRRRRPRRPINPQEEKRMSTATLEPTAARRRRRPRSRARTTSTSPTASLSWLLTKDHKRIAHPLPDLGHGDVLHRRLRDHDRPPEPDDARGRAGRGRHLQPAVHHARRHHGVLLPGAGRAGGAGQLLPAADDRRQGSGLPAASTC